MSIKRSYDRTAMTKKQAYQFVWENGNNSARLLASLFQFMPEHKGKASNRLKVLACFIDVGFGIGHIEENATVNGYLMTWEQFDMIGESLRKKYISKEQISKLIEKVCDKVVTDDMLVI